jgi:hypothetical protein
MKLQHRANINVLLSSLVWGLILGFAIRSSRRFITDESLSNIFWYGGNFLVLMLYPSMVSFILRKRTGLWLNAFFFSALGSTLSTLGMFSFNAFQNKAWIDIGIGVFGIWLVMQLLIPGFEQNPAVQREWGSPLWEKINDSSFLEFLFCWFYSIDNNAA